VPKSPVRSSWRITEVLILISIETNRFRNGGGRLSASLSWLSRWDSNPNLRAVARMLPRSSPQILGVIGHVTILWTHLHLLFRSVTPQEMVPIPGVEPGGRRYEHPMFTITSDRQMEPEGGIEPRGLPYKGS